MAADVVCAAAGAALRTARAVVGGGIARVCSVGGGRLEYVGLFPSAGHELRSMAEYLRRGGGVRSGVLAAVSRAGVARRALGGAGELSCYLGGAGVRAQSDN